MNFVDVKPIFADEILIMLKVKAAKDEKENIEKEGQISLIFIDMAKNQALGEFVITKNTAKALAKILPENIANLERQLADKSMPKNPATKSTTEGGMYR